MKKNENRVLKRIGGVVGTLALVFGLCVIFIQPVRDYMNSLFHRADFREERIIGTVSSYNPRVREIQGILSDAGYYDGVHDGLMGEKTRVALREFQENRGLEPSGRVDEETVLALNRAEHRESAETLRLPPPETPPRISLLPARELPGGADGRPEAEGGARPAASTSAASAVAAAAAAAKSPPVQPAEAKLAVPKPAPNTAVETKTADLERVKKIQVALKKAGYYNGTVDGKLGPATAKAIKEFQKAAGLKSDGVVGKQTWEKLRTYR